MVFYGLIAFDLWPLTSPGRQLGQDQRWRRWWRPSGRCTWPNLGPSSGRFALRSRRQRDRWSLAHRGIYWRAPWERKEEEKSVCEAGRLVWKGLHSFTHECHPTSLVPRPSPTPVFDRLQYTIMEPEHTHTHTLFWHTASDQKLERGKGLPSTKNH